MSSTTQRPPLRDVHLVALDLVAAGALLAVLAPQMRDRVPVAPGVMPSSVPGWVPWLSWGLAAGVAVPILVRRRWPLPALGVVGLAATTAVALLDQRGPGALAGTALALYSVASTVTGWPGAAALGLCLAGTSGAAVVGAQYDLDGGADPPAKWADPTSQIALGCLLLVAAWAIGLAVRQQRALAASKAEQEARQALSAERQRIARELHDIVAHGMSLIAVKAAVANHVADTRPEEARDALRHIEAASRGALVDLRYVLGVLRTANDAASELTPTPGLANLAVLGERAAQAGVAVQLAIGNPHDLPDTAVPEGIQLSAYRIVQEALTNVVKHAGPVRCRVDVTVDREELSIQVVDDGRADQPRTGSPVAGHGLLGMRERVAAYGGSFTAGARTGGGFAVCVTLPYQATSR